MNAREVKPKRRRFDDLCRLCQFSFQLIIKCAFDETAIDAQHSTLDALFTGAMICQQMPARRQQVYQEPAHYGTFSADTHLALH